MILQRLFKLALLGFFCFCATFAFAQADFRTDNKGYTSRNDLIIPFKEGYAILGSGFLEGRDLLCFYNNKHELLYKKTTPAYNSPSIMWQDDTMAVIRLRLNYCDVSTAGYFKIYQNGKFKSSRMNRNSTIDYNGNFYFVDPQADNIAVHKVTDSTFVKKISTASFGKVQNIIIKNIDTLLIGNSLGEFMAILPNQNFATHNFVIDKNITMKSELIDFSKNYFSDYGTGSIYSKNPLRKIGTIIQYYSSIKEINGCIYDIRNISDGNQKTLTTITKYNIDNQGLLQKTKTWDKDFSLKSFSIYDVIFNKNKWILCGQSSTAFYPKAPIEIEWGYNDMRIVLDSLSQDLTPRHDMKPTIPMQQEPVYDKKCSGYLYTNFEIQVENLGKDTLREFQIKGNSYGGIGAWCFLPSTEEWAVKNIKIAPKEKKTLIINDMCIQGFGYGTDSTRSLCLRVTAPNGSLDANIKDNVACTSFKKSKNEVLTHELPAGAVVNAWANTEQLFLNGNLNFATAQLSLFDLSGRECFRSSVDMLPQQFELPDHLANGLYICHLVFDNQYLVNRKVVLQR
jgi:hypothetical protein